MTNETEFAPAITLKEPGDEAVGRIEHFSMAPSNYGGDVLVVTIQDATGDRGAIWASNKVLRNQLSRLQPEVGELIHVRVKGQREGANGVYRDFSVTLPERPAFTPDWDRLGGSEGDPMD